MAKTEFDLLLREVRETLCALDQIQQRMRRLETSITLLMQGKSVPDILPLKVGDLVRATFWGPGMQDRVELVLPDGRVFLGCSENPWKPEELEKLEK